MGTPAAPTAVAAELRRLKPLQWTRTEAERVLQLWRASGRPLQTFAREHGLVPQRLRRWRDLIGEPGRPERGPVSLVPAVIIAEPEPLRLVPGGRAPVIVHAAHECAVEVVDPDRVTPTWVAGLIVALETSA
jgi:hypothetical protein